MRQNLLTPAMLLALFATASLGNAQVNGVGQQPYLGWSSFSEQTINSAFLTQANIQAESDALKSSGLEEHGFAYINIDSGWQGSFDSNGRPLPSSSTFPDIKALVDHIHANGQKAGIYWIPGIEQPAVDGNYPVLGTSYHTQDIVVMPLAKGNSFAGALPNPYHDKIDFTKPGAQEYIDSIVALFASWGIDFIKLDAVTPGSYVNDLSIDNRPDVEAYSKAITSSGRPMWLTVSWQLDQDYLDTWQQFSNARRIDDDVECEGNCGTGVLTNWPRILVREYDDVAWQNAAGPTAGWNDLDTLDVGDGIADGITATEKQTAITLWSMANSPLYLGGDLTNLDDFAKSAFTNDELLAVDQSGHPAAQMVGGFHPVWMANTGDGSVYVAMYNLTAIPDRVDVRWSDLGFNNATAVRDLWNKTDLGAFQAGFSAMILGHGSRILKVTPDVAISPVPIGKVYEAEAATLSGSASIASCSACSGGLKVGNIGGNSMVTFANVNVTSAGTYQMEIGGMTQGPRTLEYSVNGGPAQSLNMSGGSYMLPQSSTVPVTLSAGNNTIAFGNPSGYGADLDRIAIRGDGKEPSPSFTTYEAEGAQLAGTSGFNYSSRASGGAYVGNFGGGASNTVTFPNVTVPSTGTYQMEIDYVTSGQRTFFVTVNGGTPIELDLNGTNFSDPVPYVLPVQLNGGVANSIVFSNPNASGYAPGLDSITIALGANTAPTISPAGGSFTTVQTVTLSDTTADAAIYYTTDGSTPSTSSTLYTAPITVAASETVRAIAIAAGYPNSSVASATYTLTLSPAATPTFTPAAGTYTSVQSVTISDATIGANIYYTTDGTTPSTSSTLYSGPISIALTATIEAIAVGNGSPSALGSAAYNINLPAPSFSLTSTTSALTIAKGQQGSIGLSIASLNGFSGAVTFNCSGLLAASTCSFTPATVTPTAGASASTILTVLTSMNTAANRSHNLPGAPVSCFALAALCLLGRKGRRSTYRIVLLALSAVTLSAFIGCGGNGSSKKPPTQSTVTVTATSGAIQQSTTITITVQ
ncbi:chitobiase/beta-hexosaminidase C-terminal domain-containing protein [Granulicella aggregans]|nr:chitobiase/beta-hexosaminidase C-terminal domain-containing protein [Granulicella aggregans]